jgi:Phycobilisome protein
MMNQEFQALINAAEDHYLPSQELYQLKQQVDTLGQRLEAYELLHDREVEVFQAVADQLQSAFPNLDEVRLNRALEDGLAMLRYAAMAMLQQNPEYLQRRWLEDLGDRVQAYELVAVEQEMLQLIQTHLSKRIAVVPMSLIQPYLDQVQRQLAMVSAPAMAMA